MASKVQERIFVEGFLQHLGPKYVILEERESPDFLMSDGQETFGLEVAQIFRDRGPSGSPSRAAESRRVRFLRRLASTYYSRSGSPLHVQAVVPDRFEADTVALADQLKAARPRDAWAEARLEVSGAKFRLVSLPAEAGQYSRWVCVNNSVGWQGRLTLEDVEPVMADKALKLPGYRMATDRVELLLVVDATKTSGMVRWSDGTPSPVARGFDAIHLYVYPYQARRLA